MADPEGDEEDEHDRLGAERLAKTLGLDFEQRALGPVAPALESAADQVGDIPSGDALEELYARARAAVLRTMGEASDAMVLATGNKSKLSIGAGILGGDMTGDFAPLRDLPEDVALPAGGAGATNLKKTTTSPRKYSTGRRNDPVP